MTVEEVFQHSAMASGTILLRGQLDNLRCKYNNPAIIPSQSGGDMSKPSLARRTARWKSKDRTERHVRAMLETRDDYFENHWIDKGGRGEFLPLMLATVPGQYDAIGRGIDILAMDFDMRLWILEVSRGTPEGGGLFKGGGKPVKYAGGALQMSASWRGAAFDRFLGNQSRHAFEKVRVLLDLPESPKKMKDNEVERRVVQQYRTHRKGIIVPEGVHFDTTGTDIDYNKDVYTFSFPNTLLDMWYRNADEFLSGP